MSEAVAQIQESKARGLAVWSDERGEAIPDVPTGMSRDMTFWPRRRVDLLCRQTCLKRSMTPFWM